VCGTSATVYPAAALPLRAQSVGAPIIEVNLQPTQLTAQIADVYLQGTTTEVLAELARRVLEVKARESAQAAPGE
jgi:NAD-dependent deacetylase